MSRLALAALLSLSAFWAAGGVSAPGDSLRQLGFSPDGRHILAQDDSAITVLTANPLDVLFRIPAEMAGDAQFTTNSQQIAFVSSVVRPGRPAGSSAFLARDEATLCRRLEAKKGGCPRKVRHSAIGAADRIKRSCFRMSEKPVNTRAVPEIPLSHCLPV